MRPFAIVQRDHRLLEDAKAKTKRAEDGSFNEEELATSLAQLVPFDVDRERLRKAREIIERSKRPGSTEAEGQLNLPGFNRPVAHEPNRMVSDEQGNIIESVRQLPHFMAASLIREQENVERAVEQMRVTAAKNKVFQDWALQQALAGRPALDLTWGNCARETGILSGSKAA